jgi:hypothetical protein
MEATVEGYVIKIDNIITDKSLDPRITRIDVNHDWVNGEGESAIDSLGHFHMHLLYDAWSNDNPGQSFNDFMHKINSGESVTITLAKADDGATEEYDPTQTTLSFNGGDKPILSQRIVFANPKSFPI